MSINFVEVRVAVMERAFAELFTELVFSGAITCVQSDGMIARLKEQCVSEAEVIWTKRFTDEIYEKTTFATWSRNRLGVADPTLGHSD